MPVLEYHLEFRDGCMLNPALFETTIATTRYEMSSTKAAATAFIAYSAIQPFRLVMDNTPFIQYCTLTKNLNKIFSITLKSAGFICKLKGNSVADNDSSWAVCTCVPPTSRP